MSPLNIVIVDDDSIMRSLLRIYLLRDFPAFQVWDYPSAEEAMEKTERGGADLLITDYMMPKMDGPTLVGKLRALGFTLPIIMISEHDDYLVPQETPGVDRFIAKRFLASELAPALRSLLTAA